MSNRAGEETISGIRVPVIRKEFKSKSGRPCYLSAVIGDDAHIRYLDDGKIVTVPFILIKKYLH